MHRIPLKFIQSLVLCSILLCIQSSCGFFNSQPPEEALLEIFTAERDELIDYNESTYVEYMRANESRFMEQREKTSLLITQINNKFDAIPEDQRQDYQKKWREKFQPIINDIYRLSKQLVVKSTPSLTPEDLAQIKEFSLRRAAEEKSHPQVSLKPVFFESPRSTP